MLIVGLFRNKGRSVGVTGRNGWQPLEDTLDIKRDVALHHPRTFAGLLTKALLL